MKTSIAGIGVSLILLACGPETGINASKPSAKPLVGTWQLVSGTIIEQGDTTTTVYNQNISFIKIINDTHFAFLQHDLNKGKDSAVFVAGGGRYSLTDSLYTEHLEYCSARDWERNDFTFTVTLQQDTLVQRGTEEVASAGINRVNIEKYIKVKK